MKLPEPSSITFFADGAEGVLYAEDGKLCFKGDLAASAQVLMQYVCDQMPEFARKIAESKGGEGR